MKPEKWGVFFYSSGQEPRFAEAFDAYFEAETCCESLNRKLQAQHPGTKLLCGYEIRGQLRGQWHAAFNFEQEG